MIQVQDVTKAFAGKKLFESVSTTFPPGRLYGHTCPNGACKSTFMRILGGELEPDTVVISRPKRFSVLKQDQYAFEDRKVLDVVLMGNASLWEAMQEKERLLAKPDLTDEDGARLGELEGVIAEEDGYSAEAQAATLLEGLGIYESDHPRLMKEMADKMKKRAQLQEFVARFSAGTRASQVQSRIKQLEKLSVTDLKKSNIARPFIKFEQKRPSGKQTLTIEGLTKGFDRALFEGFSALVTKGEKVAVVGRNGVGKTTLLRTLIGELEPDAGKITWGHEAQVGYMPQDVQPIIPTNTTCFDYLHDIDPSAANEEIRGLLGRMLFRGDEGMKPTSALSGGEAVRLLFCKLMLTKPNVLVLDEPTNHLDLEAISALGEGLVNYPGTVVFVAHDRDLIDTAATRILAFHHGGLEDFAGEYETFLEKHGGFIDAR